jgi:hypothetical protein
MNLIPFSPAEKNPIQEPNSNSEFICIYSPINKQEMDLIKMTLKRENIPYFEQGESADDKTFNSFGTLSAKSYSDLYVTKDVAEKAIYTLEQELNLK